MWCTINFIHFIWICSKNAVCEQTEGCCFRIFSYKNTDCHWQCQWQLIRTNNLRTKGKNLAHCPLSFWPWDRKVHFKKIAIIYEDFYLLWFSPCFEPADAKTNKNLLSLLYTNIFITVINLSATQSPYLIILLLPLNTHTHTHTRHSQLLLPLLLSPHLHYPTCCLTNEWSCLIKHMTM